MTYKDRAEAFLRQFVDLDNGQYPSDIEASSDEFVAALAKAFEESGTSHFGHAIDLKSVKGKIDRMFEQFQATLTLQQVEILSKL